MCGSQQDCVSACVYHKKNNSIFLAVRLIDVEVVVMLRTDFATLHSFWRHCFEPYVYVLW